ncbi:glycosyl hydrolase [Mucilaginibacter galii]|uniref:DNA-binding protein n=1 Tax=Mucilaginibacter galii TaxID=2005073 RepID=A0A917JAH9_9SPHI|nr:glycosyl hydrolase [Mucilaginibacter galii]GGI51646.1 DNA-binding protein [Mucilaginibacter galii]
MKKLIPSLLLCIICLGSSIGVTQAQVRGKVMAKVDLEQLFKHPPQSAKPWVFWYWMQAAVTKAGITADLEAMKLAGMGGAYLMPIKGVANPAWITPPVEQLTPEWWAMVKFAMQEADRLGLQMAMHDSDGFALAGGPWITPELSMQKVVWSKTLIKGGQTFKDTLQKPESYKGYYKDIAVLAYLSLPGSGISTKNITPQIASSVEGATNVQFLADPNNKKNFISADSCWMQLTFAVPFTCRSLVIRSNAPNYQAERLTIAASNDGKTFRKVMQLQAPRHGWQDNDADITQAIRPTTAKYFRFIYNKEGSEPGAEDLDFAKWKQSLKITGIELSSEPRIHQYEGKTGEVWRISKNSTTEQLPDDLCIPKDKIINITNKLDANGRLNWDAPAGNWTILRIGHTSTGHTNATGGKGAGLECDKFNPDAIKLQFDSWFGEAFKQIGPDLAKRVLKVFHVDSWECGSQNWSTTFAQEFQQRRGYNLMLYLPVMAGVPVESAARSEKVLADVRQTIAELVVDKFYGTMSKLAHEKGCTFSAEAVAPTMTSDGLLHYSKADIAMGEFWLRSPTHDKPNDMLDAISGGHIYGKNIIQAEAFTELRTMWDEHPGMLKSLGDRNLALGVNRLVFHVNTHNPWLDKKPGLTLDGIGLFMQRDQTWYKPGRAWIEYIQRCQALLQQGHPVTDIAVFTGEETPRRSLLPDRLIPTFPGLFGAEKVAREKERLANKGLPMRTIPIGVTSGANMLDADALVDPLHGYQYDSFNLDALMRLAVVKDGRIQLPGGASYKVLVIPGHTQMLPNGAVISQKVVDRLNELIAQGATIIYHPDAGPALKQTGKGRLITGPYQQGDLSSIGLSKDLTAVDASGKYAGNIAWNHRTTTNEDVYFISNQLNEKRTFHLSLRMSGKIPELWDAVTGEMREAAGWQVQNGRTVLPVNLEANGSVFVVFRKTGVANLKKKELVFQSVQTLKPDWTVTFDPKMGGPKAPVKWTALQDWSQSADTTIKYYSGTAIYDQTFTYKPGKEQSSIYLNLNKVDDMAEVFVNNVSCGIAWTAPYRVNISKALKPGVNQICIAVTNTWANRLMGDHALPKEKQITWTNAPYRLEGKELLPAGLIGPVVIEKSN